MKKTNKLLLIVDGENLLHRSYHKFTNLRGNGRPSGAIFGFLKSLHSNIFRFQVDSLVVVFDNGRSKFRKDILPDYKGSRKKLGMDYESLQSQKQAIRRYLKLLGVPVVYDKEFIHNYECDDYIALLAYAYQGKKLILSSDKDFCQLISPDCKIISPSKDSLITTHNCFSIMGYSPEECVDYLTLTGDSSDNIPGVPGIGPKKARDFLGSYGSIENYLKRDKDGVNKAMARAFYVGKELINLKHFLEVHPLPLASVPIKYGNTINNRKLKKAFSKYQLSSFQAEEFIETFKNLKTWRI
jgi:DNA polymerase-1